MNIDLDTDRHTGDGHVVFPDEVTASVAPCDGHADAEADAELEPQWYPPPGEPCM